MAEPFIGLIRHTPPAVRAIESIQRFFGNSMGRNDILRKLLQVSIPLPFALLLAELLWKYFIRFRLPSIFVIKHICLIEERQLPFDRLHRLCFPPKTMLVRDSYLLYESLDILIHGVQLSLHRQNNRDQFFPAQLIQFIKCMLPTHLQVPFPDFHYTIKLGKWRILRNQPFGRMLIAETALQPHADGLNMGFSKSVVPLGRDSHASGHFLRPAVLTTLHHFLRG